MKNTTGMLNLNKKKEQLKVKLFLAHIFSDPKNHILNIEIDNEIRQFTSADYTPTDPDGWMKHYVTGNQTITIHLYHDSTTTKAETRKAKRTKTTNSDILKPPPERYG
jgi:hypothetical protein